MVSTASVVRCLADRWGLGNASVAGRTGGMNSAVFMNSAVLERAPRIRVLDRQVRSDDRGIPIRAWADIGHPVNALLLFGLAVWYAPRA